MLCVKVCCVVGVFFGWDYLGDCVWDCVGGSGDLMR